MKLIDQRKNCEREMVGKCPKDLLGLMIQAGARETEKKQEFDSSPPVTVRDIVEECKTFFFAGKHTTSNLLTWTTVLLAMHPQWQVLAREEVLRVCGARDIPTKDDVVKLKTVKLKIERQNSCLFLSVIVFFLLLTIMPFD